MRWYNASWQRGYTTGLVVAVSIITVVQLVSGKC